MFMNKTEMLILSRYMNIYNERKRVYLKKIRMNT